MDINKNRELGENEKILKGHGVKMSNQDLLFTQGAFYNTGYQLDYAIQGDGLLRWTAAVKLNIPETVPLV